MKPPKFAQVSFYPGYSYGDKSAPGRYVALGEDGKVYVFPLDGNGCWNLLAAKDYE